MLRIQNKIQFRTTKRGCVWIAGFDSQCFRFPKRAKPSPQQEMAQLPEEQALLAGLIPATGLPESLLIKAAKWLGLSLAIIFLIIVMVNLTKSLGR